MLQQTQVTTVIDYFQRFMKRFPSVASLAAADIDEVLHLWSGLGYYARGRNLHKAAQIICIKHAGELPTELAQLTALPGIGRSTGSAILAIAHGQRLAILDGNVKRVLTRFMCIDGVPDSSATLKKLWPLAEALTPPKRVRDYTQAIMDLGATVCTRNKPKCVECPVATTCMAHQAGTQTLYPTRKIKKRMPVKKTTLLRIENNEGEILLYRRPPSGIWGGLWCLPELDPHTKLEQWCHQRGLSAVEDPNALDMLKHTFTHFHLEIQPIQLRVEKKPAQVMDSDSWLWYNSANPANIGLAKPMATLINGQYSN